jgi:hypothetical protein
LDVYQGYREGVELVFGEEGEGAQELGPGGEEGVEGHGGGAGGD